MSSTKLTFGEYLQSKEVLKKAASAVPKRTAVYDVKKYSKLAIGESKTSKQYIPVKPALKITVEWIYETTDNPSIGRVLIAGMQDIDPIVPVPMYWSGEKLLAWLHRNAKEITTV